MLVRVIDYTIEDGRETTPPSTACSRHCWIRPRHPRSRPGAAYTQRWEIERTFDELKTHQRGPRIVLRSKSPDLVLQEIWGSPVLPLRDPLTDEPKLPLTRGHDPDRVSFVAALRITRQSLAQQGAFPP